jgi:hypothetical protein
MFGKTVSAGAMLALLISVAAFGADKPAKHPGCCSTKAACCAKTMPKACCAASKKSECCAKKAACCKTEVKSCCASHKAK